jgi:hypothetical protein
MVEDPIGISPTTIPLAGADGASFGQFTVFNQTSSPCWQVLIRLTTDSQVVDLAELEVDILERSPRGPRTQRAGDLSSEFDVITDDELGKRARFLSIPQMRPSEYLCYYVRIPAALTVGDGFRLFLDLFDLGSQPTGMIWKDGEPRLSIQFPVPLNGESVVRIRGSYPLKDS